MATRAMPPKQRQMVLDFIKTNSTFEAMRGKWSITIADIAKLALEETEPTAVINSFENAMRDCWPLLNQMAIWNKAGYHQATKLLLRLLNNPKLVLPEEQQ